MNKMDAVPQPARLHRGGDSEGAKATVFISLGFAFFLSSISSVGNSKEECHLG